jgi:hypothetical protein
MDRSELIKNIKNAEKILREGGLSLVEQTRAELHLSQWKKDLIRLPKGESQKGRKCKGIMVHGMYFHNYEWL